MMIWSVLKLAIDRGGSMGRWLTHPFDPLSNMLTHATFSSSSSSPPTSPVVMELISPLATDAWMDYPNDPLADYYLLWEGDHLGFTLVTTLSLVSVGRVTGKGCPIGLENVRRGDVLLSVNGINTIDMALADIVQLLRQCEMPATLHLARQTYLEALHGCREEHHHRLAFAPLDHDTRLPTSPHPTLEGEHHLVLANHPAATWNQTHPHLRLPSSTTTNRRSNEV
ncbi:Aste57867_8496 [Aphanomyces stellatus]|uniref:Aste57867_8496 protein n=1 Tax=Aphanomyces stellatus TaxID=120398 RepID=A0A485KKH3_9STRA|nr:hypothetical protein As57867_008464 [Aphanomyces stellatus]VFT85382.1 Aste57867_8496 [Aphanomyces stellatus]